MNGAQDLGGFQNFGPVAPEENEPPFHESWERRAFALTLAMGATGAWNIDQSRSARESLPPVQYLASPYYGIWLAALERLLAERDLVTPEEAATGRPLHPPKPLPRVLSADQVGPALSRGTSAERAPTAPARFRLGHRVRTRNFNPPFHTRLPRYARLRRGTIAKVHGVHVFADAHARGEGEKPHWLYSVRFEAAELWGPDTSAGAIYVDCWEPYLEPV